MQLSEAGPDEKQRRTDFPWGGGSSRMGESSPSVPKKQILLKVVVAFIPPPYSWLLSGREALLLIKVGELTSHSHEWGGNQDLKGIRTEGRPTEKCLCCIL